MDAVIRTSVAALYVHGERGSRPNDTEPTPMLALSRVDVVTGHGIMQDRRFFRPSDPGRERPRQVSLIDEGTIQRHEARFGPIETSCIKSQIILAGDVRLSAMLGATLHFEHGPELVVSIAREPCFAMDLIVPGLKNAMEHGEQGSLARVVRDGEIWIGQSIEVHVVEQVVESI